MSAWGGGRGRQRAAEPVVVNVYDLAAGNDYMHPLGFGAFHSGLEVHGREYTFSSSGVFSHMPRGAPGAPFRESVVVGEVRMSSREVEDVVNRLRQDFPGHRYNVLSCNCNTFCNALAMELTGKMAPGYINRLARLGACFSCILPASITGASPVNEYDGSSSFSGNVRAGGKPTIAAFAGSGRALGGSREGGEVEISRGSVGQATGRVSTSTSGDSSEERRRKIRAAALRRMEKEKNATKQT